jgi:hypothetical protein
MSLSYGNQVNAPAPLTRSPAMVLVPGATIDPDNLVDELKTLRKGRGLFSTNIAERVRPTLGKVCGVGRQDGPAEIRRKVSHQLENLAYALPVDLRVAAMAAFGITQQARLPLYQDRVKWTAARINRDPRTARRRIDDAIQQLAQLAAAQLSRDTVTTLPFSPWHTIHLNLVVTLDGEQPETIEYRRIVANQDGLAELDLPPTSPLGGHLVTSVLYGAIGVEANTVLRLPRTLCHGETHEYALRHQALPGEVAPMRIAYEPSARCDHFDLRVRFGPGRQPRRLWALDGAFAANANAGSHPQGLLTDGAGEVQLTFGNLLIGQPYGLSWTC